jgi:hypothetical protein
MLISGFFGAMESLEAEKALSQEKKGKKNYGI